MVTLEASFGSHKSVQVEYLILNFNRLHAVPNPSGKENTLEDGLKKMRFWLEYFPRADSLVSCGRLIREKKKGFENIWIRLNRDRY